MEEHYTSELFLIIQIQKFSLTPGVSTVTDQTFTIDVQLAKEQEARSKRSRWWGNQVFRGFCEAV